MLETAILKVFSTEALWQVVNETLQIYGGQGYFTDEPYERMMRDARINTIGEGANEVLLAFIAMVGMRDVGQGLKATLEGLKQPRLVPADPLAVRPRTLGPDRRSRPSVPVAHAGAPALGDARLAARGSARFAWAVERVLVRHREAILRRQYVQERIADAAIALVTSSCTLARLDPQLAASSDGPGDRAAAELYLRMAFRRCDESLPPCGTTTTMRRSPPPSHVAAVLVRVRLPRRRTCAVCTRRDEPD